MPETMRAARYHGPGESLRLEEVPVPQPGLGEALVRVKAAGICHTELHFLSGVLNLGVAPVTLGHEIAGEVAELGPGVTSVRPGDRVIVYYYVGCGVCHWCRTGQENLCDALVAEYGFVSDGGLAEYVKAPARNLVKLPDSLPFEDAATLGCSATTSIHAAGLARLGPGEVAVVYGFGGVGAALVQYCDLAGARVIAVGRSPAKLQLARDLGAEAAIDATREDVPARVRELTGGQGADAVFELVGTERVHAEGGGQPAQAGATRLHRLLGGPADREPHPARRPGGAGHGLRGQYPGRADQSRRAGGGRRHPRVHRPCGTFGRRQPRPRRPAPGQGGRACRGAAVRGHNQL